MYMLQIGGVRCSWPVVSLLLGVACHEPCGLVQVVQPNWHNSMSKFIHCTLYHTPVVMYLQAEVVWLSSGGVIVHTRSNAEYLQFLHWGPAFYTVPSRYRHTVDNTRADIPATCSDLSEQFLTQDLLTNCTLNSSKGGWTQPGNAQHSPCEHVDCSYTWLGRQCMSSSWMIVGSPFCWLTWAYNFMCTGNGWSLAKIAIPIQCK